jgi:tRNA modification GTPase
VFLAELIKLRTYIEAAIDFSDEQIDFIKVGEVEQGISNLRQRLKNITAATKQGVILQEGLNIVIAGRPNAGKSSLLNTLCRREEAIVTDIPGTTRDIIKANLNIQGVPVCLFDTAGLRQTVDLVEQEGVKRAVAVINKADFLLLILDGSLVENNKLLNFNLDGSEYINNIIKQELDYRDCDDINIKDLIDNNKFILVVNKVDKIQDPGSKAGMTELLHNDANVLFISAKENYGIDKLEELILHKIGFKQTTEGKFTARRRHLESLTVVEQCLNKAEDLLNNHSNSKLNNNIDLIAEELRHAQDNLSSITGEYTSDDLLGSIFSSFCIGK